jgi:malate dehydrogenase (oxaloacetate-decarboxylating)(NADP+)
MKMLTNECIGGAMLPAGLDVLRNPFVNKGTAFSEQERDVLSLRGLLPPRVHTLEEQVLLVQRNLKRKPGDLERYNFLMNLRETNETLFNRVLLDGLEDLLPIICSPAIIKASLEYGDIFRAPQGIYISARDKNLIYEVLQNWPHKDIRIIIVSDGEHIRGCGDLGTAGMHIPVRNLPLYSVCAGIHSRFCLPVLLDVGTENKLLLDDPLYIGLKQPRLRGEEYDEFIEEFIEAAEHLFPGVIIHLEGFSSTNTVRIVERFQERVCCMSDIQGMAAVILAGLYSAQRIARIKPSEHKLLFLGAGGAGLGIADLIVSAMVDEGLSVDEARSRCWFMDSRGLIVRSRTDLSELKKTYAHDCEYVPDLLYAVEKLRPTGIIGISGKSRLFTPQVLQAMGRLNERPLIFSLSMPARNTECSAEDAYLWTEGRAIFTSSNHFHPVAFDGKTLIPVHGDNLYILCGVAMGALASGAEVISNKMLIKAARALAQQVSETDISQGRLFPPVKKIKEVSAAIALAVAEAASDQGRAKRHFPDVNWDYMEFLSYGQNDQEYTRDWTEQSHLHTQA